MVSKATPEIVIDRLLTTRARTRHIFNFIFWTNLTLDGAFVVLKLRDWVNAGMQSRRCFGKGDSLTWMNDVVFFFQFVTQICMLVFVPSDIVGTQGRDGPFSGDSHYRFYQLWQLYLIFTVFAGLVSFRVLAFCGVCEQGTGEYCSEQILFTVLDWMCLFLNFLLLFFTYTRTFRNAFRAYCMIDSSLGNPPTFDWTPSRKPILRVNYIDGEGFPISFSDSPFEFAGHNTALTNRQAQVDEEAPLLASEHEVADEVEDAYTVTRLNRIDLVPMSVLASGECPSQLPNAVRIGTARFPPTNLGQIEFLHYNIPKALVIPEGTFMRVRPRDWEARAILNLKGNQDLKVEGFKRVYGTSRQAAQIFLSHVVRTNKKRCAELKEFLSPHGYSVFMCEDIVGGENFRLEIARHVMGCISCVVMLDKKWVESKECEYEFLMARKSSQKTGFPVVTVVQLEDDPRLLEMFPGSVTIKFDHADPIKSFQEILERSRMAIQQHTEKAEERRQQESQGDSSHDMPEYAATPRE